MDIRELRFTREQFLAAERGEPVVVIPAPGPGKRIRILSDIDRCVGPIEYVIEDVPSAERVAQT